MNYDLNIEQKLLKDSAREFFRKEWESSLTRLMAEEERGFSADLWRKMAELGWMGLLVPDPDGQYEMGFLDMAVLLYEMGYACFPGPFFSSAVLGILTILAAGNEQQKRKYLPGIAEGDRITTLAWTEASGTYNAGGIATTAELRSDHYVLSGVKLFVPYAHVADTIICVARTSDYYADKRVGVNLFLVERKSEGLSTQPLKTLAGDKQCEVVLDRVKVRRENLLGPLDMGWPILMGVLHKAAVAKCAEMCGGAQRVLEMVVDHAKKRIQFDRPIGSFQAVQHHCADILTCVDTSMFMTFQAGWRIAKGLTFEKEASMSKAWVSDAYRQAIRLGHQIMGGTGFMEETDLQLYFKQGKTAEVTLGDADFHRELVAQQLGL